MVGYSLSLEGEVTREQIMALSPKDNPNVIKRCFCELEAAGHLEYYSQYGDYGLKNKIRFHPIPIPAEERTNRTHWKKKKENKKTTPVSEVSTYRLLEAGSGGCQGKRQTSVRSMQIIRNTSGSPLNIRSSWRRNEPLGRSCDAMF